jgi:hypothetical protein
VIEKRPDLGNFKIADTLSLHHNESERIHARHGKASHTQHSGCYPESLTGLFENVVVVPFVLVDERLLQSSHRDRTADLLHNRAFKVLPLHFGLERNAQDLWIGRKGVPSR